MNLWLIHLKAYHAKHPSLSYKQAMTAARPSYKKPKQSGKGPYAAEAEAAAAIVKTAGESVNKSIDAAQTNRLATGANTSKLLQRKSNAFKRLKHRMTKQTFPTMSDEKLWEYIDKTVV